jgi:hypothetical protein
MNGPIMKLSKLTKEAIVRAIWNEVPEVDYKAHKEAIQKALVALFTPEVKVVYDLCPDALKTTWHPTGGYELPYEERHLIVANLTDEQQKAVHEPFVEEYRQRQQAMRKLEALVMGCSTRKQLVNLLPECEKYLPAEASTDRSLPVVANVIADLTKLGWPKK